MNLQYVPHVVSSYREASIFYVKTLIEEQIVYFPVQLSSVTTGGYYVKSLGTEEIFFVPKLYIPRIT